MQNEILLAFHQDGIDQLLQFLALILVQFHERNSHPKRNIRASDNPSTVSFRPCSGKDQFNWCIYRQRRNHFHITTVDTNVAHSSTQPIL